MNEMDEMDGDDRMLVGRLLFFGATFIWSDVGGRCDINMWGMSGVNLCIRWGGLEPEIGERIAVLLRYA
jgi:hypothetical protein